MSADTEEQKTKVKLHTIVGELLAAGNTNSEILEQLQVEHQLNLEEANETLRGVYNSWSSVQIGLDLQPEDDRNWHKHLRMKLLQRAIKDVTTPSQRLALLILDSLAAVQGISVIPTQIIPLSIELVEKKKEE